MSTGTAKDPKQYPVLRNLQFSPVKEGEEQYVVLWDPSGLSKEKLVLPLNYFFIIQHFDGDHSLQQIGGLYLKRFGEFLMPNKVEQLVLDLEDKLFLEGHRTEGAKEQARAAYRQTPVRRCRLCRARATKRTGSAEKTDRWIFFVEGRAGFQAVGQ